MNSTTIVTPDNIEIEYRLAGVLSRFAAASIDVLVQAVAVAAILFSSFYGIMGFRFSEAFDFDYGNPLIAVVLILVFLIVFGYYPVCELSMGGQTIGKKIFRLRAIRESGKPIGLAQSIVRNVFRYTVDMAGPGAVAIIFSKKCKRVGDMAASTVVVAENSAIAYNAAPTVKPQSSIELPNLKLVEDEIYLIKEYFGRRSSLMDYGESPRSSITKLLGLKFECSQEFFTDAVLEELLRINL